VVDDSLSEATNLPALPDYPGQFILYQTEDGWTRVEVRIFRETVWLSQKAMAELFQKDVRTINEHVRNVFSEGELHEPEVIRKFRITASDGKQYDTLHYNLDVIISVGYRVKSHRGTQFRIWATQRLREYLIKGFALDDQRLKQAGGGNYFDEPLAHNRDAFGDREIGSKTYVTPARSFADTAKIIPLCEQPAPRRWGGKVACPRVFLIVVREECS
jgi:hypothetical protein